MFLGRQKYFGDPEHKNPPVLLKTEGFCDTFVTEIAFFGYIVSIAYILKTKKFNQLRNFTILSKSPFFDWQS